MKSILRKIPAPLKGKLVEREQACSMCNAKEGLQIGEVDYWDIKNSRIIKCEKCGLIQLDPMLSQEETARGCLAYFIEESLRVSEKEQEKNFIRNFRRGVLFGYSIKRKSYAPGEILELGPGSGAFSEGLKFVFPDVRVTVMDVNEELLLFNKKHHQFETIQSAPENFLAELENKFDLIIARDILEHVIDVATVIQNVNKYCKPGGLFHFITPNGHEDVWKHYLTYTSSGSPSELLINHVNYFDGKGLLDFLQNNHFSPIEYFTYKIKTTRKGKGWKTHPRLMAGESTKKNSDFYVNTEIEKIKKFDFDKEAVMDKWYINDKRKFLTRMVSWYSHMKMIKVSPELNVGHEISGLFIKVTSN